MLHTPTRRALRTKIYCFTTSRPRESALAQQGPRRRSRRSPDENLLPHDLARRINTTSRPVLAGKPSAEKIRAARSRDTSRVRRRSTSRAIFWNNNYNLCRFGVWGPCAGERRCEGSGTGKDHAARGTGKITPLAGRRYIASQTRQLVARCGKTTTDSRQSLRLESITSAEKMRAT